MLRRFLLVGIAVILLPGSVTQLMFGFIVSFVYLLLTLQTQPYLYVSGAAVGRSGLLLAAPLHLGLIPMSLPR